MYNMPNCHHVQIKYCRLALERESEAAFSSSSCFSGLLLRRSLSSVLRVLHCR
jgi:hypothetical protein